ncbi:cupin domain-containing protein [Sulfitobacter sp. S190]|uniref:cupin domain-containing protein n=1 Tax=Sulfitobacter sp. S190 TaxID=2867022 RepID=UPI0021A64307|nr:cupin domain-containing protein [Sulfitobacter sp. S190]UWR20865.1 cupin domain-containing protein [Sulfitobacter sp. S190]
MSETGKSVIRPADIALDAHWSPKVVGQVNNHLIKVAKLEGEFVWHQHDDADEMFLIVAGHLRMQYEDGDVHLGPGDIHVVPKGTPHNPVADAECRVVLIEPPSTLHTGEKITPLTRSLADQTG